MYVIVALFTTKGGHMNETLLDVKVGSIHRLAEGRVKAFVDIVVNDAILIKGVRVIEGKKGMFVSMPSEQGKDEKWYDRVRCLSDEVKDLVSEKVLEGYR